MTKAAGQVISGSFDSVVVRQKSDSKLEIGQLLTADTSHGKVLMQVFNLVYGSQLSQQNLEMVSGMKLEGNNDLELIDSELRNYTLAYLKPLLIFSKGIVRVCKTLPDFFSSVNELEIEDTVFLEKPHNPLMIGNLRNGSKNVSAPVYMDCVPTLSHHLLIAAQTGRGKSNLMSCLVFNALKSESTGFLILDPHDEYYGRSGFGLKNAENVVYYTPHNPPPGARTLIINLSQIRPSHFNGVVLWSDPQKEALYAYYNKHGKKWIESVLLEEDEQLNSMFHEGTIAVIRRRLLQLLNLEVSNREIYAKGIFNLHSGMSTISDVVDDIEKAKAVIIDTSSLSSKIELFVGSIVAAEIFYRYQNYKTTAEMENKPVASIVLEEAPRVLGKEVLEQDSNVFSRIAREGRKFKVALIAITQLPSLIPRQILANMGTKIILGLEMAPERKAIIESAAQDLSKDDRAIASLDIGEAILTSTFSKFAIPVKIPLLSELIKKEPGTSYKQAYAGLKI